MSDTVSQTPTRHRRVVMLMIFVCVAITFLDRGNISLTPPLMGKELGIDAEHMGWIFSGFSWTYALFQIPSSWMVDLIRGLDGRHIALICMIVMRGPMEAPS